MTLKTKLEIISGALASGLTVKLGDHKYIIQDCELWIEAKGEVITKPDPYDPEYTIDEPEDILVAAHLTFNEFVELCEEAEDSVIFNLCASKTISSKRALDIAQSNTGLST